MDASRRMPWTRAEDTALSKLEALEPVVVFSPHLDDAVLSCGHFLHTHPSTTVVTVLAGAPDVHHDGYNSATTGDTYAPDAVNLRREEDRRAMEFLGVTPRWLELLDSDYAEYRPSTDYREVIQGELAVVLDEVAPKSVFAPLGLIHPDHVAVSEACATLATEQSYAWYFYMDLPYGIGNRRSVVRRLASLRRRLKLVRLDSYEGEPGVKQQAMSLYQSQYEPTRQNYPKGFDETTVGTERYWRAQARR